jgi:hypothetical protein
VMTMSDGSQWRYDNPNRSIIVLLGALASIKFFGDRQRLGNSPARSRPYGGAGCGPTEPSRAAGRKRDGRNPPTRFVMRRLLPPPPQKLRNLPPLHRRHPKLHVRAHHLHGRSATRQTKLR